MKSVIVLPENEFLISLIEVTNMTLKKLCLDLKKITQLYINFSYKNKEM